MTKEISSNPLNANSENRKLITKKNRTKKPAVNAKAVMTYLTKHPDFFTKDSNRMRELIKQLRLVHPASKREVSLMMYQNHLLRQEMEETKKYYGAVRRVIQYERELQQLVFTSYQEMEKAQNLPQLCRTVDSLLGKEFNTQEKRLVFFTKAPLLPYYHIKSYPKAPAKVQELMAVTEPSASHSKEVGKYFFDEQATKLGSYLILPLRVKKKPFAVLCLGDKNKQRFEPDAPNLLMHFFASILARELHHHLKTYKEEASKKTHQLVKK